VKLVLFFIFKIVVLRSVVRKKAFVPY